MSDDLVKQALAELADVVCCRCGPGYRNMGRKDPACECDSAPAVRVVSDRIKELEVDMAKAMEALRKVQAFVLDLEPYADQGHTLVPALREACEVFMELRGKPMSDDLVKMARLAQRDDRMATGALYGDLADRIEELEAKLAMAVDQTLDAASAYLKQQYGLGALSHPVDRGRIIAELKGKPDE